MLHHKSPLLHHFDTAGKYVSWYAKSHGAHKYYSFGRRGLYSIFLFAKLGAKDQTYHLIGSGRSLYTFAMPEELPKRAIPKTLDLKSYVSIALALFTFQTNHLTYFSETEHTDQRQTALGSAHDEMSCLHLFFLAHITLISLT